MKAKILKFVDELEVSRQELIALVIETSKKIELPNSISGFINYITPLNDMTIPGEVEILNGFREAIKIKSIQNTKYGELADLLLAATDGNARIHDAHQREIMVELIYLQSEVIFINAIEDFLS